MKRKEINRKMTLMLESSFPSSTRHLLLVCIISNSKVIKNILKPCKLSVGQLPEQKDPVSFITLPL